MDMKSAAQTIRDTVDMDQILSIYGYRVKHGFMVCPFHGDTDASLKVYKGTGGWHCYGCGRGGSVIDFVMEHEGCDFRTAVRAIDHALSMNMFSASEDPYEAEERKRVQKWLDDFVRFVYEYCEATEKMICAKMRMDLNRMKTARDKDVKDRTAEECLLLLYYDEEAQYDEYRIDRIDEFREEVAAWRRKARRAGSASSRKK
jgi:DNA primase